MKILYLTHPESDFGEYFLFNGLCHLYGSSNVITYPMKKTYYGMVDDDYILDDGSKGFTSPGGYIVAKEETKLSFDDIVDQIDSFDLIILSSGRTYAVNALREIKNRIGKIPRPLVFTEHEDGDGVRFDVLDEFVPDAFFKRELLIDRPLNGATPLPFSSANDSFPVVDDTEKKHDVFAMLGATWPLRTSVVERLIEYNIPNTFFGIDIKIRGDFQEHNKMRLSYDDYLTGIAQSKIAISVRGHGRDTVRYWEIPAYDTMMLVCHPGLRIPNDFEDGKNAVFFKEDMSDLKEKIDYYLKNDDERKRIAKAGKEHLLKYHTNKARAQYFIDCLNEKGVIK